MGCPSCKAFEQMETPSIVYYEHSFDDTIIKSLSKNVLNLGNECRALAEENARLRKAGNALFHNLLMVKHHCPDNGITHHVIDASIIGWNPKYGKTE